MRVEAHSARDAGVTLIEMLVVLAILGVMAAAVGLTLPGSRGSAALGTEADLLAARLGLATEASIVTGRPAALDWETEGYRFVVPDSDDGWAPHPRAELGTPHALPEGIRLMREGVTGSGRLPISPDAAPPPAGMAEIALAAGAARETVRFDGLTAWREETR